MTLQLGHKYSEIVPAIHTHMAVPIDFVTNPHPDISFYSDSEKKWHEKNMNFVTEGNGYFQIQASRPQTGQGNLRPKYHGDQSNSFRHMLRPP